MPKRKPVKYRYVYKVQRQRKPLMRYERPQETTGIVKVFDYLIGIPVFGLVWFILADPMNIFDSTVGPLVSNNAWVMYLWAGSLVIYLVFGAFYFLSSLREEKSWR